MKTLLQALGRIVHFFAWPAYWVYFRRNLPRTRVILQRQNNILVVKQWIGDGRWQLPGGGLHAGEDPAIGAARELNEETGVSLKPEQLKLIGKSNQAVRGMRFDYYVFTAQATSGSYQKQVIEISDARWVHPAALNLANARPDALAAIRMLNGL